MNEKTYEEQYKRMKRWYNRLKTIYLGIEHQVDSEYYQDEMYAFFQNCYHFKDWLKNDSKILTSCCVIENFANRGPECLKICGDLCNGSKHMRITRREKIDKDTKVGSRDYNLVIGNSSPMISVKYNIECSNEIHDALLLAESCINEWVKFMNENNIAIPSDD